VLGCKRDAEAFDAEMRRRRRIGDVASFDGGERLLVGLACDKWTQAGRTEPLGRISRTPNRRSQELIR
jgi:hypothetical protein